MKKLFSVILAVCLFCSAITFVSAETRGTAYEWEVSLKEGKSTFDTLEAVCDIQNLSDISQSAVAIFAWYDAKGALLDMKQAKITHKLQESKSYPISVPYANQAEACLVKAFIWKDLKGMSAISNVGTISLDLPLVPLSTYEPTLDDFYDKLDGSTVTQPLSVRAASEYAETYVAANAVVKHNKTDTAIKNVIDGTKDLALVTYPSEENLKYAKSKDVSLAIVPVVNDAFVFLANEDNPVNDLTQQQAKDIYSGKITNWSELGGNDEAILPLQRNSDSGSQSGMLEFMGDTPISVPFEESEIVWAMGLLLERVSEEPTAIGYSYYYYTDKMMDFSNIKLLRIDGVEPSDETIQNGTYPIITPYYAVFQKTQPQDCFARSIVQYLLSEDGQKEAGYAGYIGLSPSQIIPLPNPVPGHQDRPPAERKFTLDDLNKKLIVNTEVQDFPKKAAEPDYNQLMLDAIIQVTDDQSDMFQKLSNKEVDVVLCTKLCDEIPEAGNETLEVVPVAGDAFIFMVNNNNPVTGLTSQQIKDIYAGKITAWDQLGGWKDEINVFYDNLYSRDDGLFCFMGTQSIGVPVADRWRLFFDEIVPYDFMLNDWRAFGYSFLSKDGKNYKPLLIDTAAPGEEQYPMNVTHYAVLRASEEKDSFARRFVASLQSEEGQELARTLGYLPAN